MSRSREELVAHLRTRFGEKADPAMIVDALFGGYALDDSLPRRYVVRVEFERRYATTDKSARQVQEDIAFEYGLGRTTVVDILGR